MEKWIELKIWLSKQSDTIQVAEVLDRMIEIEATEGRRRRLEFDEPFDGEY